MPAEGQNTALLPWCTLVHAQGALREGRWPTRVISDLLWSLPVPQLFVCHTLQKKKGHFDHHPRWATQPNVCAACIVQAPVSIRVYFLSCVYTYRAVFLFCFFTGTAAVLVPPRVRGIFFSPRSTSFFFFFFYLGPALFHQVCVFLSLTGAFMRAAVLKATYIIKRAGVSYRRYICVAVFRY